MTRKYRSQSEWQEIIQHQKESGLNALAFCRQHGLSSKSFYKRRLEQKACSTMDASASSFIKLKKSEAIAHLSKSVGVLHYNNCQLHLNSSADVQWIAQLIRTLS